MKKDNKNNTGYRNTGYRNTGDCNTGYWNTGNWNTGNWNTGNWNTGNWNTGYRNTGDCNTGNWNTGNWNTGDWNTGNWNTVGHETGFFNTKPSDIVRVFNREYSRTEWDKITKPSFLYFDLTKWIPDTDMTDKEKIDNPTFHCTGGYLKKLDYKEAFQEAWNKASQEDRDAVKALPNFDADVFFEISGIRVDEKPDCSGKVVEIDGVKYQLQKLPQAKGVLE